MMFEQLWDSLSEETKLTIKLGIANSRIKTLEDEAFSASLEKTLASLEKFRLLEENKKLRMALSHETLKKMPLSPSTIEMQRAKADAGFFFRQCGGGVQGYLANRTKYG